MKYVASILFFFVIAVPTHLQAQLLHNAEFSGGWAHSSGNEGLDGFNLGASLWFTNRISVGFDFDRVGSNKSLPLFALTNVGLITTKSTMYDYLFGPRVFFGSQHVKILHTVHPFLETQFGLSHITSSFNSTILGGASASDNAGSWLVGGGADILFSPHWSARGNLDFFRTHFEDAGQSRLRFKLGVAYTFGSRKVQ